MGFTVKKVSEKGSQKEGGSRRCPECPLREYDPLGMRPNLFSGNVMKESALVLQEERLSESKLHCVTDARARAHTHTYAHQPHSTQREPRTHAHAQVHRRAYTRTHTHTHTPHTHTHTHATHRTHTEHTVRDKHMHLQNMHRKEATLESRLGGPEILKPLSGLGIQPLLSTSPLT